MIGRGGAWQATVLKPARAKVDAKPVPEALGVRFASSGYASSAGALACFAAFKAAAISADVTPFLRYPIRTYKHEIDQTGVSSTRLSRHARSSHGNASRGVS